MKRKITGFHKDSADDWVAELECFHNQHVRHDPPFQNRAWTLSDVGREAMIGTELNCVLCSELNLPEHVVLVRRTPEFNQDDFPAGLKKDHSTKSGTWGRINVVTGNLYYHCQAPVNRTMLLSTGMKAPIPPELLHYVKPDGPVRFFIEFFTYAPLQSPKTVRSTEHD